MSTKYHLTTRISIKFYFKKDLNLGFNELFTNHFPNIEHTNESKIENQSIPHWLSFWGLFLEMDFSF